MQNNLYPIHRGLFSLLVLVLLSALTFQSQAQSGAVTTTQSFSYTGQIVTWTAPTGVTSLTIEARGAEGGNRSGNPGKGAIITGTVTVTPGQQLSVLVGQQPLGSGASIVSIGGGGGSFVVTRSNPVQPLVIAGGGGGSASGSSSNTTSRQGQSGTSGGAGTGSNGSSGGAAGTPGNGGVSGQPAGNGTANGGGGGGLLTDGQLDITAGGKAFVNGGAGGSTFSGSGGFGGGGGGTNYAGGYTGGGGGGYTGGGGGSYDGGYGGGGGSYNVGTNQTNTGGVNSGNGLVTITYALPAQPIRYVKQGGTGDGSSWTNASGDLQSQINIAGAQQVWVAAGTYKPGPANNTDRTISFVMKEGVAIYGGFPTSNSGTMANRNPASFTTVLSGDIDGDGTLAGNSYHVVSITNASATTRLDGFVITSGNAAGGGENNNGGGIYNVGSGSNRSNPTLVNLTFIQHIARFGAGLFNRNANPSLTNISFSQNMAVVEGGGIYNDASNPLLTNCLFSQNSADNGGAMLNYRSSNPLLTNCSFSQNTATTQGGALRNNVNSHPSLINCILWENGGQNAIVNLTSTNGSTTANFCLIEAGETDFTGSNNRTATVSPFVSATNFQLTACSVAIDAGSDGAYTSAGGGSADLAGNPRLVRQIDMGTYEFQGTPAQPVAITQQPVSGSSVCVGSSVTAMVSVTGTSPAYQWYKDNLTSPVAGQTSATLTLTNVQLSDAGSYSVVVTGSCNSVTSTAFSLTVNAPPAAPALSSVSRTVTQSDTPLPLNQFVNADNGNTLSFSGVNGPLTPPNANVSQVGAKTFSVTQTNASGCVSAATPFTITVQPSAPTTPTSQTVCRSSRVVLSAPTTGRSADAVRYEWYKNGTSAPFKLTEIASIQKGTNTASLTLVSVQTTASYYVKVFAANNSVTVEGPFVVTVNYGCTAPGARLAAPAGGAEETLSVVLKPNPLVDGQLRAVVRGAGGQPLRLTLVDLRGELVRTQGWEAAQAEQEVDWELSTRPAGLYLLRVQTPTQTTTLKVIQPY